MSGAPVVDPVLVTGATGDLGSAIARELVDAGRRVVLAVRRPESEFEAVAARVPGPEGAVRVASLDLSTAATIDEDLSRIRAEHGELSGLVHAAGMARDTFAVMLPEGDWDAVVGVNLKAAAFLYRSVARSLLTREPRGGAMVFLSSVSAERGVPGQAAYAASKGGLEALARVLAKEGASLGIRVNCVAAGAIAGRMIDAVPEKLREELQQEIPMGRWGRPEEVARVVRFLLGDESSYMTGSVVRVDGGLCA